ncbi:hypothetical protein [Streptomyces sp. NPDC006285]|uniref:hypothetical protein n=1 Tax=Streptomyces sp. NPDC006285 TaxID=3364742 RepID=UPI00369D9DB7
MSGTTTQISTTEVISMATVFADTTIDEPVFPQRALTVIRPDQDIDLAGIAHCIQPCCDLQDLHPDASFFLIADLQPLTEPAGRLPGRRLVENTVHALLALGIDPEKCSIYRQSDVPHVFELMWLLDHLCGDGPPTDRATSLRAADLLGLRATTVAMKPKGRDALDHARQLARRCNAAPQNAVLAAPSPVSTPVSPTTSVTPPIDCISGTLPVFGDESTLATRVDALVGALLRPGPGNVQAKTALLSWLLVPDPLVGRGSAGPVAATASATELKKLLLTGFLDTFAKPRQRYRESLTNRTLPAEVLAEGATRARREIAKTVSAVKDILSGGDHHE